MLLLGGLSPSVDNITTTVVRRLVSTVVGKIYKIRSNKLRDLEASRLNPFFTKGFSSITFETSHNPTLKIYTLRSMIIFRIHLKI